MPSLVNETNISSSANSIASLSKPIFINSNTSVTGGYDPSGDLGYGIGKLLKGAFDQVWDTWQNWWNPAPSQVEIALQRQAMIYKQGLAECVTHLDRAIDNLRKNPNDPQSMEKIKKLVAHYERYVQSAPTEELRSYQQKVFQQIEEKIEKFASNHLKEALMQFLPLGSSKDFAVTQKREFAEDLSGEPVASKSKRAVMQQFPASFNLNSLDGSNGFTVPGVAKSGGLGSSVSTAGDINGDGISDLVLGAWGENSKGDGASYVIFGSRNGFLASFNLIALNGTNGFTIPGVVTDGQLGYSVSTAGDINGDNVSDLVLGASLANSYWGVSYVIFGSRSGFPASFNLNTLNGVNGFTVPGVAWGGLGSSVSNAGDINGDGIADLVLGALQANSGGASYVIFGSRSGFPASFNLNILNGVNGFTVPGVAASGWSSSVSNAGDINGDGIADLVLGASRANSAYVIFGSRSGFPAIFKLTTLNGTNGFTVPGVVAGGSLGYSVSTAGDMNGDNIADLVLGAPYAKSAYVIFGSRSGFPASFNLNTLNGVNGFTVPGIGYLGWSVSAAGDINGDNLSDLVLGDPYAYSGGTSYVIFGSRSGFPASFNLDTLRIRNGVNGFTVSGIAAVGYLGNSVSTAGDINGDSVSDLVLGAYNANYNSTTGTAFGASYVIFGKNASIPTTSATGAIVGGVIGGVVGIAALAGLGYGFFRCCDKRIPEVQQPLLNINQDPAITGHRP